MKDRSNEIYIAKSKPIPAWLEIAGNVALVGTAIAVGVLLYLF